MFFFVLLSAGAFLFSKVPTSVSEPVLMMLDSAGLSGISEMLGSAGAKQGQTRGQDQSSSQDNGSSLFSSIPDFVGFNEHLLDIDLPNQVDGFQDFINEPSRYIDEVTRSHSVAGSGCVKDGVIHINASVCE